MAPKPEDSLYTKRPSSYYEAKNVAYRAWAIVGCVVVFVLAVRGLGLIVPAILPFNIIKGVVVSVLTALVYKSISNLITPAKDQVKGR